jgi:peptidoglycan/LPS O-acetylase OafA/YrhL
MLFHQTVVGVHPGASPVDKGFQKAMSLGFTGVDLFFVISGFLITGILFDAKGKRGYFVNFYARRTLRIFPLYYAIVFLCLVVIPMVVRGLDPGGQSGAMRRLAEMHATVNGEHWWYWAYLSNWLIAARSFAPPSGFDHPILDISWSLAIEEQFYILWPLAVFFLGRKRLMWLCAALVVGAAVARFQLREAGWPSLAVYVLTPCRFDGLALGALVALWARGDAARRAASLPLAWVRWCGIGSVACATGAIGVLVWEESRPGLDHSHGIGFGVVFQTLGFSLVALGFTCGLVYGLNTPATSLVGRFLRTRPLLTLGKYSYALYLFHLPIRAAIRDYVFGPHLGDKTRPLMKFPTIAGSEIPGQLVFYFIATAAALALALLSWHLFEKHFLRLKTHFEHRPAAGGPKGGERRGEGAGESVRS